MMVDFRKCVTELEQWKEGKALILCGNDGFFCSGGDLDFARATGSPKEGHDMSYWMQDILRRFRRLPLVSCIPPPLTFLIFFVEITPLVKEVIISSLCAFVSSTH